MARTTRTSVRPPDLGPVKEDPDPRRVKEDPVPLQAHTAGGDWRERRVWRPGQSWVFLVTSDVNEKSGI